MKSIVIQATINAPREIVWDAWTLPEHITQLNFASPDWCGLTRLTMIKYGIDDIRHIHQNKIAFLEQF